VSDLVDLPDALEGGPPDRPVRAVEVATGMRPVAALTATLGAAQRDLAISLAAAHHLVTTDPSLAPGPHSSPASSGQWAGSLYGDQVATILARLARPTGRGRALPRAV